jgi:hypothetical protein
MCELTYRRNNQLIPETTIEEPLTATGWAKLYVESLNNNFSEEAQQKLFEHIDATFDRIMKEIIKNDEHE